MYGCSGVFHPCHRWKFIFKIGWFSQLWLVCPLLDCAEAGWLEIFNQLKYSFTCQYDEKDAIGRRYRRQDAIGTPYCVTVDFESLDDNMVTIRERDSLAQERVPIDQVEAIVSKRVDMKQLF